MTFFSIGTRRKEAVKESINPLLSCRFSWNSLGECLLYLCIERLWAWAMRVGNYFSSVELSWSTFIVRQGVSSLVSSEHWFDDISVSACFDAITIMIII